MALPNNEGVTLERLIACVVEPGTFPQEYYVRVDGEPVSSAYVSERQVVLPDTGSNAWPSKGQVRAYVINDAGPRVLVELPGEAVVGGLRTWVSRDKIKHCC